MIYYCVDRLAAEKPDILTGLPRNISGTMTGDSIMKTTKRCLKCKKYKQLSEFYISCKSGLQSYCKSCCKISSANYQKTEKGIRTNKLYAQTAERKAVKKRFRTRNQNQIKAQNAVNHAIQACKMSRPDSLICHHCPTRAKEYHHHLGYAPEHWYDVIPVCLKCHQIHKRKIA